MKLLLFLLFINVFYLFAPVSYPISKDESTLFRCFSEQFTPELLNEALQSFVSFPEVAMAQSKLETGNFSSVNFRENNNLFGMRHPQVRETFSLGQSGFYAYYSHWIYSVWDYELMYRYYLSKGKDIHYFLEVYCPDEDYRTKLNSMI